MQKFVIGETVPFEYTFLDESETPHDLANAAIAEIGVLLMHVRKERLVQIAKWTDDPAADEKALSLSSPTSNGMISGVLDPEFSATLLPGKYVLRFYFRMNTGVNALYPDSYDRRFFANELEFELV